MPSERFEKFLLEYEDICRTFSVVISACSCCNGPILQSVPGEEYDWVSSVEDHIEHLRQKMDDYPRLYVDKDKENI